MKPPLFMPHHMSVEDYAIWFMVSYRWLCMNGKALENIGAADRRDYNLMRRWTTWQDELDAPQRYWTPRRRVVQHGRVTHSVEYA